MQNNKVYLYNIHITYKYISTWIYINCLKAYLYVEAEGPAKIISLVWFCELQAVNLVKVIMENVEEYWLWSVDDSLQIFQSVRVRFVARVRL